MILTPKIPALNTPEVRAFLDHYDQRDQKARRVANAAARLPVSVDVSTFSTVAGDGTTSVNTGTVSVAFGTTSTSRRSSGLAVTIGKRYRLTWTQAGTSGGQLGIGTSLGGSQYRPTIGGSLGSNTVYFTATTATVFVTVQRASAGTTTFSGFTLNTELEPTWADTALISAAGWTLDASATVNTTTGVITLAASGTLITARQSITTTAGTLCRLKWTVGGNTTQTPIGSSSGGAQYRSAALNDAVGSRTYEFRPTTTTTWIQFQRTTAGTATVSNIAVQTMA